ncbi:MAG: hypothetical protein PF503_00140 [Desulfobacula sp.]|jgi:signal transduction histidine kinase|nr:hypothetical protein [Desulfobacula sp.]
MFKEVIGKIGFIKMLIIILSLCFFFSVISGLVLYKNLHVPLGPHFGATHIVVTELHDNLLFKTIIINLIFYCITAIGFLLLGVLYSHRIAGPLVKVTRFAEMMGKGKFDQRIDFRKKDVIHSLSAVLNEMSQAYENRCNTLSFNLNELEKNLNSLKLSDGSSEHKIEKTKKIMKLDAIISKTYKDLVL